MHLVGPAGDDGAHEPPAGVCHIVEAHAHGDLIEIRVGEDKVGVHCGVDGEDDPEQAIAAATNLRLLPVTQVTEVRGQTHIGINIKTGRPLGLGRG